MRKRKIFLCLFCLALTCMALFGFMLGKALTHAQNTVEYGYFEGVSVKWQNEKATTDTGTRRTVAFKNNGAAEADGWTYMAIRTYHRGTDGRPLVFMPEIHAQGTVIEPFNKASGVYAQAESSNLYTPELTLVNPAIQYYRHVGANIGFDGYIVLPRAFFNAADSSLLDKMDEVAIGSYMGGDNTMCGQQWDFGEIRLYYGEEVNAEATYQVFCNPVKNAANDAYDTSSVTTRFTELTISRVIFSEYAGATVVDSQEGAFDGINFNLMTGSYPNTHQYHFVEWINTERHDFTNFAYVALRVKNNVTRSYDTSNDTFEFWLYDDKGFDGRKSFEFKSNLLLGDDERIFVADEYFNHVRQGYLQNGHWSVDYSFNGWLIVPRKALFGVENMHLDKMHSVRIYANKYLSPNVNLDLGQAIMFEKGAELLTLHENFASGDYKVIANPAVENNANVISSSMLTSPSSADLVVKRTVKRAILNTEFHFAALTPTGDTKVRRMENYRLGYATTITKNYFEDVSYVMDGIIPEYLFGQSFLYGKYYEGVTGTVKTDGDIVVAVPKLAEYNGVRAKIAEQNGVKLEEVELSSYDGVAELYRVPVKANEKIDYGKGILVFFQALASLDDYYVPCVDTAPTVITDPDLFEMYHLPEGRQFLCASSIVRTKGGRMFSVFSAGGQTEPDNANYVAVLSSDDDGKTWTDPLMIIDHEDVGVIMVSEMISYLPNGNVFIRCATGNSLFDTREDMVQSWGIMIENPDADSVDEMEISAVYKLFEGYDNIWPCKKIEVCANGELLMVGEDYSGYCRGGHTNQYAHIFVSKDGGYTWEKRSTATFTNPWITCLETMLTELSDGTLWLLARIDGGQGNGLEQCFSYDGGYTWENYAYNLDAPLQTPGSRYWCSKLSSGNLIFIANASTKTRTDMTVWLSEDDGKTWQHSYYVEKHYELTSFGVCEGDGYIYISYDRSRMNALNVRGIKLTEDDIRAGKLISEGSRRFLIGKYSRYTEVVSAAKADGESFAKRHEFVVGTSSSSIISTFPKQLLLTNDIGQTYLASGTWSAEQGFNGNVKGVYIFQFTPNSMPNSWKDDIGVYDPREVLHFVVTIVDDHPETCTVTFMDGETLMGSQTVNYGETLKNIPSTEKAGYEFKGWYADKECTVSASVNDRITKDVTLYAKYLKLVKITYNTGDVEFSVTVYAGEKVDTNQPTKEGQTFIGWYLDREFTSEFSGVATEDVTLYAKWSANGKPEEKPEKKGGCNSTVSGFAAMGLILLPFAAWTVIRRKHYE